MDKKLLERVYQETIEPKRTYIQTGFQDIDDCLAYCEKGSIITIGGAPSIGKTAFAMNLAKQLAERGEKCLYFTFKISAEHFIQRLMCLHAEVDLQRLVSKHLSEKDLDKLSEAKKTLENFDLHIQDKLPSNIEEFEEIVQTIKPDYIFIDNIQGFSLDKVTTRHYIKKLKEIVKHEQLSSGQIDAIEIVLEVTRLFFAKDFNKERYISTEKIHEDFKDICLEGSILNPIKDIKPEYIIMDYIAKCLKITAKKHKVGIFVNSTLTEAPDFRQDHRPVISDLKAPSSLAELSDTIMLLYRACYYGNENADRRKIDIVFAKNSKGFTGSVPLYFDNKSLRIQQYSANKQ